MKKTLCIIVSISALFIGCSKQVKTQIKKDICVSGDCVNGTGTMHYADGLLYEGQWKDGKRKGQGTMIFPDGSNYVGQWKDGKYNGQGIDTFPDGVKYIGQFKDGFPNGEGTVIWPNGDKYIGQWKDGKQDGQGTMNFVNGTKYVGQFKDGVFDGQGTHTKPNGDKYVGQWKNDMPSGYGFATTIGETDDPEFSKTIYTGETINGIPEGKGTFCVYDKFRNLRLKYIGSFKENRKFGKGIQYIYDRNGTTVKIENGWFDGEFLGEK